MSPPRKAARSTGQKSANARLIAAAPSLFEALKGCIEFVEALEQMGANLGRGDWDDYQPMLDKCRTALAKAGQ